MSPTPTQSPSLYARAYWTIAMVIISSMIVALLLVTTHARWTAQTGETMTGTSFHITSESFSSFESIASAEFSSADIDNVSSDAHSRSSMHDSDEESVSSVSSAFSESPAQSEQLDHSGSSVISSSNDPSSSSSLPLPTVYIVSDVAGMQSMPVLAIAKDAYSDRISDIAESLTVTLTGFGKKLQTDMRLEETDTDILAFIETPETFRPGDYRLTALWIQGRAERRMMEQLFDIITGAEETVLLETTISLGMAAANTDATTYDIGETAVITAAFTDGNRALVTEDVRKEMMVTGSDTVTLTTTSGTTAQVGIKLADDDTTMIVTRSAAVRTGPGSEEVMTVTITPDVTFIGSVTERVPAGFVVTQVKPVATITAGADATLLTWEREWIGKSPVTMTYTFTTPIASPLFAQFGPLEAEGTVTGRVSEENVIDAEMQKATEATEESEATDEYASVSSIAQDQIDAQNSSISSVAASDIQETSAAVTSSSVASVPSESSVASASSESSDTGAELSWFRSLILRAQLSLESGQTFRFHEERRWAMLVLPLMQARDNRDATALLLRPLHDGVFDANSLPSFTLIEEFVSGTGTDVWDSLGHIQEDKALTAVIRTITNEQDIQESILSDLLQQEGEAIGAAVSDDSDAVNALLQGTQERSPKRAASRRVEESMQNADTRQKTATVLGEDAGIRQALDTLMTQTMEEDIVEAAIRKNQGKKSRTTTDIVEESSDLATVDALTNAVVDSIWAKDTTKQQIADVVAETTTPSEKPSATPIIQVLLRDASGKTFQPSYHFVSGSVDLVLEPERAFTPGLYTLEVSIHNPLTGETTVQTANFAWGVLAMNASQDRYVTGDIVDLAIGVLDDYGEIICDAELTLEVKRRETQIMNLTTADDSIETSTTCGTKEAGLITPDYATSFTAVETGMYELTLTATTANGTRSITSMIEVADPLFIIKRIGATRLWPMAPSPMHICVTFNAPVTGTITETVPADFILSDIRPAAIVQRNDDGTQELQWKGTWKEGEQATFHYLYDAPDISPQFYLLGPLKISSALPFLFNQ